MLLISYTVNLLVLIPLLTTFALRPDQMDLAFGPPTDARRILVCVYAAFALTSVFGLMQMLIGNDAWAAQLGLTLFSVQILYKLLTVVLVGLQSPVVLTNLAVVGVHGITVFAVLRN